MKMKRSIMVLICCVGWTLMASAGSQANETGAGETPVEYNAESKQVIGDHAKNTTTKEDTLGKVQEHPKQAYPTTNTQTNNLLFLLGLALVVNVIIYKKRKRKINYKEGAD
ncbi:LPXTG cell wall anchor domain-containing protein [Enterococcus avium]|uniref:LPXTG cell wall anchor domain-containing protein n=1 Tax=Enterococcus avium TaxID=33945 RepID=UPI001F57D10E|nr:LPXTG cell wall anchor domain-containing protein [Enterococcus avium]